MMGEKRSQEDTELFEENQKIITYKSTWSEFLLLTFWELSKVQMSFMPYLSKCRIIRVFTYVLWKWENF